MTLTSRLPTPSPDSDPEAALEAALDVFVEWAAERGLTLYPAQEEAALALAAGSHVVLATPTGSGKSLVAVAAHAQALATGRRSWYTAPIKALVSEKFFDLVSIFGAEQVGMLTGDASVNPDAPIICATAEVLANHALREREASDVGLVVMDEFHFYGEPDRGWAWQVPLLLLPRTQVLAMSATLGDTTELERDLQERTGREVVAVTGAERPVPLRFEWVLTPVHETLEILLREDRAPVYVVSFTQAGAVEQAQALASVEVIDAERKRAIREAVGGFAFRGGFGQTLRRLVLHGIGVHHAGMLPKYRRLVETLAQRGLLAVICGTDTLGVGINVPIRTVLLTSLSKYDGRRQRVLRAREFHQIAGRAGRAGFDAVGYVVVQAPEHAIENAKALAKAGSDPKKQRRVVRKKPPEGTLTWTEATYDKLVAADPEPLQPKMRVTHAMVLGVLERPEGQQQALRTLVLDNHESEERREQLVERTVQVLGSLLRAEVVRPDDGSGVEDWLPAEPEPTPEAEQRPEPEPDPEPAGDLGALGAALAAAGLAPAEEETSADEPAEEAPAPVSRLESWVRGEPAYAVGPFGTDVDLHRGFALNQPLSAFALAALELFDPEAPGHALDVVSVIEATLDDPRPVLLAQQHEARGEAIGAMKAQGMEYEERMAALDDVTWPKPLAEELEAALRTYRQSHPWVDPRDLSPKAVVREMYERAMTFGEFCAHHKLARAEGVVLRYLTDAYRALRATVPTSARTEEVEDLISWLGETVRHTDSSLLDEWEALIDPTTDPTAEVRPSSEDRPLSANPRALRVMVRQAMFRRVELLARARYADLAALDALPDGLDAAGWQEAHEDYLAEYSRVDIGPGARGPALFVVQEGPAEWTVVQVLDDEESDHDWRITATLDVAATDEAGAPALRVDSVAPLTG